MWSKITSETWKRDEDEVKSAKILIEEARMSGKHGMYTVEPIDLELEPGITAVAFALPDVLKQFGGRVRELSLDSACEFEISITINLSNLFLCQGTQTARVLRSMHYLERYMGQAYHSATYVYNPMVLLVGQRSVFWVKSWNM